MSFFLSGTSGWFCPYAHFCILLQRTHGVNSNAYYSFLPARPRRGTQRNHHKTNLQPLRTHRNSITETARREGLTDNASNATSRPPGSYGRNTSSARTMVIEMALTRDFKETVQARVRRDPEFRERLLIEGVACMLSPNGNPHASNLFEIIGCIQRHEGLQLEVNAIR